MAIIGFYSSNITVLKISAYDESPESMYGFTGLLSAI